MTILIELADAYAESVAQRTITKRVNARAALSQGIEALQQENAELRKELKAVQMAYGLMHGGSKHGAAPQAPAPTDTDIDQSYRDHFGTYMPDREPLLWVRKLLGAAPQAPVS